MLICRRSYPLFSTAIGAFVRRRLRYPIAAMSTAKPIVSFVTGNQKKLEEVVQILAEGVELPITLNNVALDLPEHQVRCPNTHDRRNPS